MILTFLAPNLPRPVGGAAMIFEFASALGERGHDVHVLHLDMFPASDGKETEWFDLDDRLEHHFLGSGPYDPSSMAPEADVLFGNWPEADQAVHGRQAVFVQGYRMLRADKEHATYHAPIPKICIARWLVDIGIGLGVPEHQLVHVPLGLRHDVYRLTHPIEAREPVVSFCFNPHPQKGARDAFEALRRVKERVPGMRAIVYGATTPDHDLPSWMSFHRAPSQDVLVEQIYNQSRVFLMPSTIEGFGLPAAEAMACGSALVTTDNGGSGDYAVDGETALVCPPGDVDGLAEHTVALLTDDARRIELATAGHAHVRRFSWPASAARLEAFAERYVADPAAYR